MRKEKQNFEELCNKHNPLRLNTQSEQDWTQDIRWISRLYMFHQVTALNVHLKNWKNHPQKPKIY